MIFETKLFLDIPTFANMLLSQILQRYSPKEALNLQINLTRMVAHTNHPSTIETKAGARFKEVWAAHFV